MFLQTERRHVIEAEDVELHPNFRVSHRGKIVEFDFLLKNCPHSMQADSTLQCSRELASSSGDSTMHFGDEGVEPEYVWARFKNVFSQIDGRTFNQGYMLV